MLDFDFLRFEDVIKPSTGSSDNRLSMFKDSRKQAEVTDYSILLGCSYDSKYGWYYLRTPYNIINKVDSIDMCGSFRSTSIDFRSIGARPIIRYSKIKSLSKIVERHEKYIEVQYGEYPQTVVGGEQVNELQFALEHGFLNETGKKYTIDKTNCDEYEDEFVPLVYKEYEYKDNKYIVFEVGYNGYGEELPGGISFKEGDICFIKVEPVRWLVDEKADIAVSKKVLFAGIKFSDDKTYTGDFKNTFIKKYLNTYFSEEIIPSKLHNEKEISNPYNFDFREVSEEEIIKGCVEANIAVMLHGKSGDGKSARVKELDPDAEILYLINASPESLCGKSIVLQNGEMKDIPPIWYTKLVEKCEKEPDKIHIVFFDEITNASGSIQGMAFNIVLDKEIDGKWKLPENARIVAAGNEFEESMSAYKMSEPLFNRFAHVDIETKVEDWLLWASTSSETYERLDYKENNVPMKIHPSVYAFIAYKGEKALRTKYTGKEPNADPRKWEMASKVLYETSKPEMIRSLVGKELTMEFVSFCQQRVITIEDVVNGNYTESDLDMNTGEKYNTAVGLSSVSIEHFEKVREFVKKLGREICATFETLWAHEIEERLEKIQEIKLSERIK